MAVTSFGDVPVPLNSSTCGSPDGRAAWQLATVSAMDELREVISCGRMDFHSINQAGEFRSTSTI